MRYLVPRASIAIMYHFYLGSSVGSSNHFISSIFLKLWAWLIHPNFSHEGMIIANECPTSMFKRNVQCVPREVSCYFNVIPLVFLSQINPNLQICLFSFLHFVCMFFFPEVSVLTCIFCCISTLPGSKGLLRCRAGRRAGETTTALWGAELIQRKGKVWSNFLHRYYISLYNLYSSCIG